MVSMGILSALLLMMTALLDSIQDSWSYADKRISQFREARVAFDLVSKNLSQATMNTYWDLQTDNSNVPTGYVRTSELHFITLPANQLSARSVFQMTGQALFFQAPLGASVRYRNLNNLFNARGYFVGYGSDDLFKPLFLRSRTAPKYRFRLIEFRPPAEANQIFADGLKERLTGGRQNFTEWFNQSAGVGRGSFQDYLNPLAENIITLVVAPRDSINTVGQTDTFSQIAPGYRFDSNNSASGFSQYSQQVPPLVRVTMVAIDEESALRLADQSGATMPNLVPPNLFTSTRNYQADILTLVNSLNSRQIGHKVFSTLVMLRSAKWSTSTENPSGL